MPRLIALVGLPGAGKTVVTEELVRLGFQKIYFGELTFDKLKEEGLEVNETNERMMREKLRQVHGMAAYALLNIPKITAMLSHGDVMIESMYSWEEYLILKEQFEQLEVLAIYAPPRLRYAWLAKRAYRPLREEEVRSREVAQIEKLHQAGPIAMADYTVVNTGTKSELIEEVGKFVDGKI
jgi:dephospho-CoA kinase